MYQETIRMLEYRGVDLTRLAELVVDSQIKHSPDITLQEGLEHLHAVLKKREVQHASLTAIELDILAEKKLMNEPLQGIIERDEGLYGGDETLALSIVDCYGSIAKSQFGHLDITKPGIIGEFNDKKLKPNQVHTFLDDILCALVAAACSRYAHQKKID